MRGGKLRQYPKIFSFFHQRHALSTCFDIFVVTYRVTNFLLKLVDMLLFSAEKNNWISIFWNPLLPKACSDDRFKICLKIAKQADSEHIWCENTGDSDASLVTKQQRSKPGFSQDEVSGCLLSGKRQNFLNGLGLNCKMILLFPCWTRKGNHVIFQHRTIFPSGWARSWIEMASGLKSPLQEMFKDKRLSQTAADVCDGNEAFLLRFLSTLSCSTGIPTLCLGGGKGRLPCRQLPART